MTETMGTGSASGASASSGGTSTRDVAKDEARGVAQDAVEGGRHTAETAKQQAGEVAGEAKNQARALFDQTRGELASQGVAQQQRAASGLRSLADDLTNISSGKPAQGEGLAADLARQASDRVRTVADYLENREPMDLLDEVRTFARRRPGAFLLSAAVAGFVGGRLSRGAVDEAREDSGQGYGQGYSGGRSDGGYSSVDTGYSGSTGTVGTAGTATGYAGTGGTGVLGGYADSDTADSPTRAGTSSVSTAPGTTSPATTSGSAGPSAAGGLSTAQSSASGPHGDPTARYAPNAPLSGTGESSSESALIEDPAGQDRVGGRQDPI